MDEDDIIVTDAVRQAVRRDDCKIAGHAFDVIVDMTGMPVEVICGRCREHWRIAERDRS